MSNNPNINFLKESYRQIIQLWVEELLPILEHRDLSEFTPLCSKEPIEMIIRSIIKDPELEEKNVKEVFIRDFQRFCESFETEDYQKGMADNYVDLANMGVLLDKGYGIVSNIIRDVLNEDRDHSKELKEYWQPVKLACQKAREIVQRKREAVFEYTNPL